MTFKKFAIFGFLAAIQLASVKTAYAQFGTEEEFVKFLRKMRDVDLKSQDISMFGKPLAYECLPNPMDPPRESNEPHRVLFYTGALVPSLPEFENFVMTGMILFENKPSGTELGPQVLPAKFHFHATDKNFSVLEFVETRGDSSVEIVKVPLGAFGGVEREKRSFVWKEMISRGVFKNLNFECRPVIAGEMSIYLR